VGVASESIEHILEPIAFCVRERRTEILANYRGLAQVIVKIRQKGSEDHYDTKELSNGPEETKVKHNEDESSEVDDGPLNLAFLRKNLTSPVTPMKKYSPARKKTLLEFYLHSREVEAIERREESFQQSTKSLK
jgi:hypothetical protein